jgi:hypothetical protein
MASGFGAAGRFPGRLDGRQQQGDQNADDGDDHQQFNQGKRLSWIAHRKSSLGWPTVAAMFNGSEPAGKIESWEELASWLATGERRGGLAGRTVEMSVCVRSDYVRAVRASSQHGFPSCATFRMARRATLLWSPWRLVRCSGKSWCLHRFGLGMPLNPTHSPEYLSADRQAGVRELFLCERCYLCRINRLLRVS